MRKLLPLLFILIVTTTCWGQRVFTLNSQQWQSYVYNQVVSGEGALTFDSIWFRYPSCYPTDSVFIYYSGWQTGLNYNFFIPNPYPYNGTKSFVITGSQLDSCNGKYTYRFYNLGGSNPPIGYALGINNTASIVVGFAPTGVTQPMQTSKPGTVTIYDIQGRFIKTSPASNYTDGLQSGVLYIYHAVYSDNTTDKGKFMIQ